MQTDDKKIEINLTIEQIEEMSYDGGEPPTILSWQDNLAQCVVSVGEKKK